MNQHLNRGVQRRGVAALSAAVALGASALIPLAPAVADEAAQDAPLATHSIDFTGEAGGQFGTGGSRTSCDLNGDGRQDTIFGDWMWNRQGATQVGAAYVYFGSDSPVGGNVADAATGMARIDGPVNEGVRGWLGWSVSCLGDVNGDGIDDMIVGTGSRTFHSNYVVLGRKDFGNVDLEVLGNRGFAITDPGANDVSGGDNATDNFGYAVSEVGDVDGDGLADIGISDNLADNNGRKNSGRFWVIAGSRSVADVDVSTEKGRARVLWTVDGAEAGDSIVSAQAVGDVNGDGFDDVAVGNYVARPWGQATSGVGSAAVVFGGKGAKALDLGELGENGFRVYGPTRGSDRLGYSVSAAGDVNGDGKADLLIGAPASQGNRGGAAVVYGSASTDTVFTDPTSKGYSVFACDDGATDLSCADSGKDPRGYWINGENKLGFAVASISDVNGDGLDDFLLGAQGGGTSVVFAKARQSKTQDITTLAAADGIALGGVGGQVTGNAGDIDGNGVEDVMTGSAFGKSGGRVVLLGALRTSVDVEVPASATATQAAKISAKVTSLVPSAQDDVAGQLSFSVDGKALDGCTDLTLSQAAAGCEPVLDVAAGDRKIEATFTPGSTKVAASAGASTLTLSKASTSMRSVELSATRTVFAKGDVKVQVRVNGASNGTVSVYASGAKVASAPVGADGSASAALPASLAAGTHAVSVRFDGTDRLESTGRLLADDDLVVAKAASGKVALKLSKTSSTYGTGQVTLNATVAGGATAGTVTFWDGAKKLGTAKLGAKGAAAFALPKTLSAGTHKISAEYAGDANHASSGKGSAVTLTVKKATLAGTPKASAGAVKAKGKPTVKVSLGKLNNGAYPAGKVTFSANGVTKTVTLKASDKGTVSAKLNVAFKKAGTVSVRYLGDANTAASATVKAKVAIKR